MICHGNGDLARDGCCYVEGKVCPLRWKVENGRVTEGESTDLGTVQELADSLGIPPGQVRRLDDALAGRTFVCSVAAKLIVDDPSLLGDSDALADAWDADPDYVAQVRPAWARIEERLGLPEGAYNCSTWRGTGKPQCCYAETPEENAAKAQNLKNQIGPGSDQD